MNLSEFFIENNQAAIAFSGGVDSAYLLYSAIQCGAKVTAYYVKSAFQPQFELEDAKKLAQELHADMKILPVDILNVTEITDNSWNRCYYCKKYIFSAIAKAASSDGYSVILDGTNASDEESDRPGMQALKELSVRSPLRECNLTKDLIRQLSKEANLFTWNKPAYACLATRIKTGEILTAEKLSATEKAESFLTSLGFSDFRIRRDGDCAKIQLKETQIEQLLLQRKAILLELKRYYKNVTLDLEVRS